MDYNSQTSVGLGFVYSANQMTEDRYSNMSDDEKREYIERNRDRLSDKEIEDLTASLGKEEDEGKIS